MRFAWYWSHGVVLLPTLMLHPTRRGGHALIVVWLGGGVGVAFGETR